MKRLLFVLAILCAIVVMSSGTAHAHRGYRGYYTYPRHYASYGGKCVPDSGSRPSSLCTPVDRTEPLQACAGNMHC